MGALLSTITTKPALKPPRIVIHGKPGVGKTSLAANAPGVLFLLLEDGLGLHGVPHLSPQSYADVMDTIGELAKEKHEHRVVAIDTIDALEPLVWQAVCEAGGKQNIEDFGYGKGYLKADPLWISFFRGLDALRAKGMTTVVLCHNAATTIDDPQIGTYTKWQPKLHKRADALMYEWADVVGYLDTERQAVDKGEADSKRTTRTSMATGRRVLHLEDRGAFVAKNRYDLPTSIQIPKDGPYKALRDEIAKAMSTVTQKKEAA